MENIDLKSAKSTFSRIGIALILFHAVTYVAQRATLILIKTFAPELVGTTLPPLVSMTISAVTMYIIALPVYYYFLKKLPTDAPGKANCGINIIWICFLMSVAISYFGGMIGSTVAGFVYDIAGTVVDSGTIEFISSMKWHEAFLITAIIGPLAEEFMFRKVIIDRTRAYGEKLSLVFSALLFGFFHMSIEQFFYAFPVGLLLGYLYLRKGKLIYCWIVHALFNLFGTIIPLFLYGLIGTEDLVSAVMDPEVMQKLMQEYPNEVAAISFYGLATMVFSITGLVKIFKSMRRVRFEKTALELPKDTEAETAFVNIGIIAFIIFAVVYPFIISM
ncbi:MAG: CPBP family intramembrane metalloprotease [Clostridia bacterium]|nr:CPBP family intramembrane metalloprotease [Clostridia bacterium]